ncbi:MAG: cupredoxin domain-containing protein [Bdellovibrionota bacterium]
MIESVLAILFFTLTASMPAHAAPGPIVGSVHYSGDIGLSSSDLFVVWSDSCSRPAKTGPDVELVQNDFHYVPHALVTTTGAKLKVHNGDKAKHNSFALNNVSFDSGLQKPGTTYDVKLSQAGITKVFCRIHPSMEADVLVLTNPCYKEIPGNALAGEFELPAPASGKPAVVWLWSTRLKKFLSQSVEPGKKAEFNLAPGDFLEPAKVKKPLDNDPPPY